MSKGRDAERAKGTSLIGPGRASGMWGGPSCRDSRRTLGSLHERMQQRLAACLG